MEYQVKEIVYDLIQRIQDKNVRTGFEPGKHILLGYGLLEKRFVSKADGVHLEHYTAKDILYLINNLYSEYYTKEELAEVNEKLTAYANTSPQPDANIY